MVYFVSYGHEFFSELVEAQLRNDGTTTDKTT